MGLRRDTANVRAGAKSRDTRDESAHKTKR
jgi:hypothetical protein